MNLKERFLKYVSYDTQSSEESTTFPSTEKQKVLLAALRDEMEALGMTEVSMDQYGYVMGTVPATPGCENAPVIGFIAHVDTSPDMSGKDVKPRVIEEYDGCDIALNGQLTMRVADFPELEFFKGHTLIHTDGGVPEVLIEVDDLTAYNVGYLIYFFWRACACSGYLLSVNPFNQPGVESYKKNMFALLGKPGYENLTAELEAKLK